MAAVGAGECHHRLVGLSPRSTQVGDSICILYGGSVPFILRRHEIAGGLMAELISESCVDGKMDGEALTCLTKECLDTIETDFRIR